MKLWVGLGNPGAGYAGNRHNVGFMAVDAIADSHGFGPWRSKFRSLVSEGRIGPERVVLLKPETFMNLSGDAAQAAMAFFKIEPADVLVFHDELDLAPGTVRVKTGGGSAGHNGLRSLAAHLGPDFGRVRIGIGHPGDKRLVTPWVLGNFSKADTDWLEPLLKGIVEGAPALAGGDPSGFLNKLNRPPAPPKPPAPKPVEAGMAEPGRDGEPDPRNPLQRLADRFR